MDQINILTAYPQSLVALGLQSLFSAYRKQVQVHILQNITEERRPNSEKAAGALTFIILDADCLEPCINQCKMIRDLYTEAGIVLIFSKSPASPRDIKDLLKIRKIGMVAACSTFDTLYQSIISLREDEYFICDLLRDRVLTALSLGEGEHIKAGQGFSAKEIRIMELFEKGMSIDETAKQMDCSKNTIATYRSKIIKKSGCRSMLEVIAKLYGGNRIMLSVYTLFLTAYII